MKVNISVNSKNEFEHFLMIFEIGLLTALKGNAINIEECEAFLFNPYTMEILRKHNINNNIIDTIHIGCELEDIESLLPNKLDESVLYLIEKNMGNLKKIKELKLPIDKIIREIID